VTAEDLHPAEQRPGCDVCTDGRDGSYGLVGRAQHPVVNDHHTAPRHQSRERDTAGSG
jgi:hypothetical protein